MNNPAEDLGPAVLALTAAFYYPDSNLRDPIRGALEDWVGTLKPHFSEKEVRSLVEQQKGTPLEPFVLTPADLDCTVTLIRASFSAKVAATRVRIVSRDTLGDRGGLVVTKRLNSYYWERLGRGGKPSVTGDYPTFFPGFLPEKSFADPTKPGFATAHIAFTDAGLAIRLKWPGRKPEKPGWVARQLQVNSRITGSKNSFDALGLRVDCDETGIMVQTGSSEAQIRLLAHIENSGILQLCAGSDEEWPDTYVPLRMPEGENIEVKAVQTATKDLCPWLIFNCPLKVRLSEDQMVAISRWLGPHKDWVDALLPQLL